VLQADISNIELPIAKIVRSFFISLSPTARANHPPFEFELLLATIVPLHRPALAEAFKMNARPGKMKIVAIACPGVKIATVVGVFHPKWEERPLNEACRCGALSVIAPASFPRKAIRLGAATSPVENL